MIEIKLKRTLKSETQTLGEIEVYNVRKVDGKYSADFIFSCKTLEPAIRKEKLHGKTAIPLGIYDVGYMNYNTPMNEKYKSMFPNHKGMIHIKNVNGFDQVYFHIGNYTSDSKGCILLGEKFAVSNLDTNQMLVHSRKEYERFYKIISDFLDKNEVVNLIILDME